MWLINTILFSVGVLCFFFAAVDFVVIFHQRSNKWHR